MIEPITIQLNQEDVLLSKLNGKKYSTFGNFFTHVRKYGFTFESYMAEYYPDLLPRCLETNELSDHRVQGYWNKWFPITKENRKLLGYFKNYERAKKRVINEGLYTEYLELEFWLDQNYKFSESLKIIHWIIRQQFYKRLHASYYDVYWTDEGKHRYIESILSLKPLNLGMLHSFEGLRVRGNNDHQI